MTKEIIGFLSVTAALFSLIILVVLGNDPIPLASRAAKFTTEELGCIKKGTVHGARDGLYGAHLSDRKDMFVEVFHSFLSVSLFNPSSQCGGEKEA